MYIAYIEHGIVKSSNVFVRIAAYIFAKYLSFFIFPGILYGMHMLYVFMVAVVLVNFLIAVMATSAAEIEHQRTTLRMLNRLATAVLLERRLHWVLKR